MEWIVGIDEVGRGALAGPVVVAAAALPLGQTVRNRGLGTLKDSKKLTARQREAWAGYFYGSTDGGGFRVPFALARVYPRQIEKRNISKAANLAAKRAFVRLAASKNIKKVFLDGGLFIGNGSPPRYAKTIVKGDLKIAAIKIASIIAKVHRDRLMRRLAKKYPRYGLEVHKGYGTQAHRRAIKKYGPCPAHRLTFLGKTATIST